VGEWQPEYGTGGPLHNQLKAMWESNPEIHAGGSLRYAKRERRTGTRTSGIRIGIIQTDLIFLQIAFQHKYPLAIPRGRKLLWY
jgi:hypothetical protein